MSRIMRSLKVTHSINILFPTTWNKNGLHKALIIIMMYFSRRSGTIIVEGKNACGYFFTAFRKKGTETVSLGILF